RNLGVCLPGVAVRVTGDRCDSKIRFSPIRACEETRKLLSQVSPVTVSAIDVQHLALRAAGPGRLWRPCRPLLLAPPPEMIIRPRDDHTFRVIISGIS